MPLNNNNEERRDKREKNRNKAAEGGFEPFLFTILYSLLSIIVYRTSSSVNNNLQKGALLYEQRIFYIKCRILWQLFQSAKVHIYQQKI